eukprot:TRINITY_DN1014_c0_g1_i1.p1 TRINITY_DN1014_c0_g1~~TRINITY_DN1014_c0_g1_i1.p1  ORF type:complete len:238 (+),score=65.58 TRINITY_DN1014_c0_g1_i1:58-771(+)
MLSSAFKASAVFAQVSTKSLVRFKAHTTAEHVKRIGVIGGGQMGSGIAQVASEVAGLNVVLVDVSADRLDKSIRGIVSNLDRSLQKGKIDVETRDAVLSRIQTSDKLESLSNVDFVVEAATENTDLKLNIFRKLSDITQPNTILASNTSSISITKIGGVVKKPENVIGMHFMNPVPVMKLVEVICGLATSDATLSVTLDLAAKMGKTTTQSKDFPGFIANRILMPYINEAVFALQEV